MLVSDIYIRGGLSARQERIKRRKMKTEGRRPFREYRRKRLHAGRVEYVQYIPHSINADGYHNDRYKH